MEPNLDYVKAGLTKVETLENVKHFITCSHLLLSKKRYLIKILMVFFMLDKVVKFRFNDTNET